MCDMASGSGTVGGVGLSRGNATNTSEDVAESFVTSAGFSTLEGIAQRQVDERFEGPLMDGEKQRMFRIPPVGEMFVQGATPKREDEVLP